MDYAKIIASVDAGECTVLNTVWPIRHTVERFQGPGQRSPRWILSAGRCGGDAGLCRVTEYPTRREALAALAAL